MAKNEVSENAKPEWEPVEAVVNPLDAALDKLRERHQGLMEAFSKETNIINRYELKIRLEEVVAIFNDLAALK